MKGITFFKGFVVVFLIVFVVWYYFYYVNMLYEGEGADPETKFSKQFVKDFPFYFDNHGLTGFEGEEENENTEMKEDFYVPYPRYWNYPPVYQAHLPMMYGRRGRSRYGRNARWWYLNYPPYTMPPRRNWFYWRNYFYG